jgi:DNA-binding LacI/PurR family transcriptional regulator
VRVDVVESPTVSHAIAAIEAADPTVVLIEDPAQATHVSDALDRGGMAVPERISVIALGSRENEEERGRDITRLVAPRTELGAAAVKLLWKLINQPGEVAARERRLMLKCQIVAGSTLLRPPRTD